jgi:hypothetical protein
MRTLRICADALNICMTVMTMMTMKQPYSLKVQIIVMAVIQRHIFLQL